MTARISPPDLKRVSAGFESLESFVANCVEMPSQQRPVMCRTRGFRSATISTEEADVMSISSAIDVNTNSNSVWVLFVLEDLKEHFETTANSEALNVVTTAISGLERALSPEPK